MTKTRKLLTILILVLSLFVSTSCITLVDNAEKEIINAMASNGVITASFTVEVYRKINFEDEKIAQGSGVVFSKQENLGGDTYYILTNNHVISSGNIYTVSDCYGNKIKASLVKSDANYDLAILKFNSSDVYQVLEFTNTEAVSGDKVIAIGAPNGLLNTITFGKILKYSFVDVEVDSSESNVKFKVIEHSAPLYGGSSGGVLLNYSYQICGINYATYAEDGEFVSGYAVSTSKVLEFING